MSDLATYQSNQLAELDKQMAVWNQRLSTLDQQILLVSQTLQESTQKLKSDLTNLAGVADSWLEQQPAGSPLIASVQSLQSQIKVIYAFDFNDVAIIDKLTPLTEDLGKLSNALVLDLTDQAKVFSDALDKAATDLATHYGIQI